VNLVKVLELDSGLFEVSSSCLVKR